MRLQVFIICGPTWSTRARITRSGKTFSAGEFFDKLD